MKPSAQQKISQALVKKGLLTQSDSTPAQYLEALKAFQRSQGLAATGYADHETLMRLGVNPNDIDKSLGTPDVKAAKANGDLSK
jgi:murein L,D-transpeptidase YcbB/YkuD